MLQMALHPRDEISSLYVSSKEGGRGPVSNEDCDDASIKRLEDYIKMGKERLITVTRNSTTQRSTEQQ